MTTPTPWKYDETWALIIGPGGEEIAAIHPGQGDGKRVNRNIAVENAQLIAAAPDLLEALEMVNRTWSNGAGHDINPESPLGFVRAAIAKATGGAK